MTEPTERAGADPLLPRVEVEGGGGKLRLIVTGYGQRIVVDLEGEAAQDLADEVLEVVEGPVQSRERMWRPGDPLVLPEVDPACYAEGAVELEVAFDPAEAQR